MDTRSRPRKRSVWLCKIRFRKYYNTVKVFSNRADDEFVRRKERFYKVKADYETKNKTEFINFTDYDDYDSKIKRQYFFRNRFSGI